MAATLYNFPFNPGLKKNLAGMGTIRPVGRVSKLFGSNGEVLANLYDTFPDGFTIAEPLFVEIDGLAVPLFLERFERRGRNGALIVFADLDDQTRAGELIGLEFSLAEVGGNAVRNDEQPVDGFPMEDLVGFAARLGDGYTGTVEEFIDGENPLFRVMCGDREVLVPAADQLIAMFDPERREIEFDLPEGLLELYLE